MSGDDGDETAGAQLAALRSKYDTLGDEVSTVSDKVSTIEGQLGLILGKLDQTLRDRESGGVEDAASRREPPQHAARGGEGVSLPANQHEGGGPGVSSGPHIGPGLALQTGPRGDTSGFHPQGMVPTTSGRVVHTRC